MTMVHAQSAVPYWRAHIRPIVGRISIAVLPLEFSDVQLSGDYVGAASDVAAYYNVTSYGKLEIGFDLYAPKALPNPIAYYDSWSYDRILEFEQLVISLFDREVNYTQYRYLSIIYAGTSEAEWAEASVLTPHCHEDLAWMGLPPNPTFSTKEGNLTLVSSVAPEDDEVTWAHELGHCLGAPDLYSGDEAATGASDTFAGPWDLMAVPNDFVQMNCELKRLFGWLDPSDYQDLSLPPGSATVSLSPLAEKGGTKCLFYSTGVDKGYAIEYRSMGPYDAVPASGIVIWRFDLDLDTYMGPFQIVNADPSDQSLDDAAFQSTQNFADQTNRISVLIGTQTQTGWTVLVSWNPVTVPVVFDKLPQGIIIGIDGVTYSDLQLPRTFNWTLGSTHILEANATALVNPGTRYIFRMWSDGSSNLSHNITVAGPADYSAVFDTQYKLTVVSDFGRPQGAGWYAAHSMAAFSVESPQPYAGPLGMLGGHWVFLGWTGDSNATSPSALIEMNSPKTVHAEWFADLASPFLLLGAIATVIVVSFTAYSLRKRKLKMAS